MEILISFFIFCFVWMLSILICSIRLSSLPREQQDDTTLMLVCFAPVLSTIYSVYLLINIHKIIDFKNIFNKLKV